MIPLAITKRVIYLFLAGFLPLILAVITTGAAGGFSVIIFFLYNLIVLGLVIADYMMSKTQGDISIERTGEENLSLHEEEEISFQLLNKGNRELYIELKDEIPEHHFKVSKPLMKGMVPCNEKVSYSYKVIPSKRGAFNFPRIYLRYEGRLKLVMINRVIELAKEYKVYPNMKNLRKYRFSITHNRFLREGNRVLKMLGRGTSFESLRDYTNGDEYKKINWKATAREGRPIVNQYEPEKNQYVYSLMDSGRPMTYTLKGYNKLDMAINTALVLSDIAIQNGDQAGLMVFDTEVRDMLLPG